MVERLIHFRRSSGTAPTANIHHENQEAAPSEILGKRIVAHRQIERRNAARATAMNKQDISGALCLRQANFSHMKLSRAT